MVGHSAGQREWRRGRIEGFSSAINDFDPLARRPLAGDRPFLIMTALGQFYLTFRLVCGTTLYAIRFLPSSSSASVSTCSADSVRLIDHPVIWSLTRFRRWVHKRAGVRACVVAQH